MFLVGLISWWYGAGVLGQFRRMSERFSRTASFFSIGQLISTLLSPYRQISASVGGDSFAQVIKGLFDQLVSRIIGGIVRMTTILIGCIAIIVHGVFEIILVVGWVLLPLTPIVGSVLFALGWVPSW